MSIENITLRKILKIMFASRREQIKALREDIRRHIRNEMGHSGSGGDFYGPFWADAKSHVFGRCDLTEKIEERIEVNARRRNLYPQLRDGFLLWWDERRRWTNTPLLEGAPNSGRFILRRSGAIIRVENLLSVEDGLHAERVIYPYFSPGPELNEASARLGLWAIDHALPDLELKQIRILDVIRGQAYASERTPLLGTEEGEFEDRYSEVRNLYESLRSEYD